MSTLAELVSPPSSGRIFEQAVRPGLADAAPSGRVRLDALARWLQDVAYADVDDAELIGAAVWVVRRLRLVVAGFPRFGETVSMSTFCSGLGRMWAERRTTAISASGQMEAVAIWIHLDRESRRPIPFSEAEFATYAEAAGGRPGRPRQQRRLLAAARGASARRARSRRHRCRDRVPLARPAGGRRGADRRRPHVDRGP